MNTVIKRIKDEDLQGIEALARINAILACPFDGRGIEDDALGYLNLLQEAFLYLRNVNDELEMNFLGLVKLCNKHDINTSKYTKSFDEI